MENRPSTGEVIPTTHVYSWGRPVYVSFLDILGFQSAIDHFDPADPNPNPISSGDTSFGLWRNCLPDKSKLRHSDPKLNFIQLSDSLVVYGDQPEEVVSLVCHVFGSALVFGVPIRGGMGFGILNHAEDLTRPGTAISLYGKGLNDAYSAEQSGKGLGMRLLLSADFISNAKFAGDRCRRLDGSVNEYPWWLSCGVEHNHFAERVSSWWSKKRVNQWFKGSQRADTEKLFASAAQEFGYGR